MVRNVRNSTSETGIIWYPPPCAKSKQNDPEPCLISYLSRPWAWELCARVLWRPRQASPVRNSACHHHIILRAVIISFSLMVLSCPCTYCVLIFQDIIDVGLGAANHHAYPLSHEPVWQISVLVAAAKYSSGSNVRRPAHWSGKKKARIVRIRYLTNPCAS